MAFYLGDNQVLAAAGCRHDRQIAAVAELMRAGEMPPPQELEGREVEVVLPSI
jgi:hypothetical protein